MRSKCDACRVEFEPKTPQIKQKLSGDFTLRDGSRTEFYNVAYHVGCWAKINKAIIHDPPPELLFMREPLTNEVRDGMVTFRVKHD